MGRRRRVAAMRCLAACMMVLAPLWASVPRAAAFAELDGFAWYSDGGYQKTGPAGTLIAVHATNAFHNRNYVLMAFRGDFARYCEGEQHQLNSTVRRSNSVGFIPTTGAVVDLPAGEWAIGFLDAGHSCTVTLTFTVT